MPCKGSEIWRNQEKPYLCNVFFIVLDLRLTKDWLSGIDSLFLCPRKGRLQESWFSAYISPYGICKC